MVTDWREEPVHTRVGAEFVGQGCRLCGALSEGSADSAPTGAGHWIHPQVSALTHGATAFVTINEAYKDVY